MPEDKRPASEGMTFDGRCRDTVARLTAAYCWRLDAAAEAELVRRLIAAHGEDRSPPDRELSQTCCRIHFAALFAALGQGGSAADEALAELFSPDLSGEAEGASVRYTGYLFRSALVTLRRKLGSSAVAPADREQLAADAAARALMTIGTRFRDCRDPDAFWGWTARVAERATIDELRSSNIAGGRSVRAESLDADQEVHGDRGDGSGFDRAVEERQVDAISVRQELVRKCRLGKLSLDQREALIRGFWGGEKPQEIAAALTLERGQVVSAAQVSLWKHRGLQVMESNLRGRGFE